MRLGVLSLLLFGRFAWSAACCGGSSAIPSVILGDDKHQITSTFSFAKGQADALVGGQVVPRDSDDEEYVQTLRLDAATLLSDRWQSHLSLPLVKKSHSMSGEKASDLGLGDISLGVTYEMLPEWSYSVWTPKGFLFFQTTLPTGNSMYEATELFLVDSRGKGFFTFSLGALFVKTWGAWDMNLVLQASRSLAKTVPSDSGNLKYSAGWAQATSLGVGYSPISSLRLGAQLSQTYDASVQVTGAVEPTSGASQTLWTTTAILSYMLGDDLSASLLFSDSTWIHASHNSALFQTVGFLLQKRWPR